jgi:hypothetical protein
MRQVVDLEGFKPRAFLTGNPAKARFDKDLRGKPKGYQQSYPQKFWISCKYPVKSTTCNPNRRNA